MKKSIGYTCLLAAALAVSGSAFTTPTTTPTLRSATTTLAVLPDDFGDWMLNSNNGKDYNLHPTPRSGANFVRQSIPFVGPPSQDDVARQARAQDAFNYGPYGYRSQLSGYTREYNKDTPVVGPTDAPLMDRYQRERQFIDSPYGFQWQWSNW